MEWDPDIVGLLPVQSRSFLTCLAREGGSINFRRCAETGTCGWKGCAGVRGGQVGAEIADYLASKGRKVTVVEMLEEIAADSVMHVRHYLIERLLTQKG